MSDEGVGAEGKPIRILLVEDNDADVRLTREALREGKIHNELAVVHDGVEAMAYLRRQAPYVDAVRPDVILLDLNMPRKSGLEVLQEVKEDADLRRIPVVILTTSSAEADVVRSYDLHANCYVQKPVDVSRFVEVVKAVDDFWFTIVRLPPDG